MWNEFKQFALRGNVVDLAIGIIIGAAFGRIVDSLVGDIFMPIIGAVTGGLDFSNYFTALSGNVTATALEEAKKQGAVLGWGNFITVAINFIIIAWILFLAGQGHEPPAPHRGCQDRHGRQACGNSGRREAADGNPRPHEDGPDDLNPSPVSIEPFVFCHRTYSRLALRLRTGHPCSPVPEELPDERVRLDSVRSQPAPRGGAGADERHRRRVQLRSAASPASSRSGWARATCRRRPSSARRRRNRWRRARPSTPISAASRNCARPSPATMSGSTASRSIPSASSSPPAACRRCRSPSACSPATATRC